MTDKVQEWEVTSEDPTRTELEDQDKIVDVTDADAPSGHNSFAPPPAKHSLFKSIGMGPPRGQSTPVEAAGGTWKRQKSETFGTYEYPHLASRFLPHNGTGARAHCKYSP
jgi:hypothetical protein